MNEPQSTSSNTPPRLNVIGAGKLGRTLARLFSDAGLVTMGAIYNRKIENSRSAQTFIGAGRVISHIEELADQPAELWMIATPDDAIRNCAEQLATLKNMDWDWNSTTVFHSSGLKTALELAALQNLGSSVASAHPAHSFASPQRSLSNFSATVCTLEGDDNAITVLDGLFSGIGGLTTRLQPEAKALYHAATVMASNYLVALIGASETLLEKAGIEDALASAILSPLMRQSLENGLTVGAANALTGPIARGDIETLQAHLAAITQTAPDLRNTYRTMGRQALKLAQKKNNLNQKVLTAMQKLFHEESK